MSLSTEVANLTTAVSSIKSAVETAKPVLDEREVLGRGHRNTAKGHANTARGFRNAVEEYKATAYTSLRDIKSIDTQKLDSLTEDLSDALLDAFVYDTSNDSDGGAWRNRTQHTSWYNETLGTTTRGNRKEFPSVAAIVCTSNKITIHDADDPAMPMWMVFNTQKSGITGSTDRLSVAMLNGILIIGYQKGLGYFNFLSERIERIHPSNTTNTGLMPLNIRQRNVAGMGIGGVSSYSIVHQTVNDVSMKVLASAPIDPVTSLPVPTIAVATDGGVSVIKDDGSVVDITASSYTLSAQNVAFLPDGKLFFSGDNSTGLNNRALYVEPIPDSDFQYLGAEWQNTSNAYERYIFSVGGAWSGDIILTQGNGGTTKIAATDDELAFSNSQGLARISRKKGDPENGLHNVIRDSYNTGWLCGDTAFAGLMDTTAETISATELVSNPDFSSFETDIVTNGDFSAGTDGWAPNSTTIPLSVVNGRLRVTEDGGQYTARAHQQIPTVVGKFYRVTFDVHPDANCSGVAYISTNTSTSNKIAQSSVYQNSATGATFYFKATTTNHRVLLTTSPNNQNGAFVEYDNVKVEQISGGWQLANSLAELSLTSAGKARITASIDNAFSCLTQPVTTVVGETYVAKMDIGSGTARGRMLIGNTGSAGSIVIGDQGNDFAAAETFVAEQTTTYITAQIVDADEDEYVEVDNFSLQVADLDRSRHGQGLNIVGNVVKQEVATGAELVSYKGDGGSYLIQPHNPEIDVIGDGTDHPYTMMGWFTNRNNGSYMGGQGILLSANQQTDQFISWQFNSGDGSVGVWVKNTTGTSQYTSPAVQVKDHWNHVAWVNEGGNKFKIYVNGKFEEEVALSADKFPTDISNRNLIFCKNNQVKISLARFSLNAPTAEQIAKIYRDEKPLFSAGAKCTLYGTDRIVRALGYDQDKKALYAGTAQGTSVFSGLQRIDNTTDAVNTVIEVNNGLVVED